MITPQKCARMYLLELHFPWWRIYIGRKIDDIMRLCCSSTWTINRGNVSWRVWYFWPYRHLVWKTTPSRRSRFRGISARWCRVDHKAESSACEQLCTKLWLIRSSITVSVRPHNIILTLMYLTIGRYSIGGTTYNPTKCYMDGVVLGIFSQLAGFLLPISRPALYFRAP